MNGVHSTPMYVTNYPDLRMLVNVVWTFLISIHSLTHGTLHQDRLDITLTGDGEKMTFVVSGVVESSSAHAYKWDNVHQRYVITNPNIALQDFDRVHTGALIKIGNLLSFLRTGNMKHYCNIVNYTEDTPTFGNYEVFTFEL